MTTGTSAGVMESPIKVLETQLGLCNYNTYIYIYILTISPPTPPRAKQHISHMPPTPLIPRTTLIHSTSAALDTIHKPFVPPIYPCPILSATTPTPVTHTSIAVTLALPAASHNTHIPYKQQHVHQSPQPPHPLHRIPIQPHRQTNYIYKDDHITTHTIQAHIPSSKSAINLIILQANINGIKNKLEELKSLSTAHLQMSSQSRKKIST